MPVAEDAPTAAPALYGKLHLACEAAIGRAREDAGLRARILRCSTLYGEHQQPDRGQGAVVTFLAPRRARRGDRALRRRRRGPRLPVRGRRRQGDRRPARPRGRARRSSTSAPAREPPSPSSSPSSSARSASRREWPRGPERGFEIERIVLDIERLRGLLGFEPTSLEEGIARTHGWLARQDRTGGLSASATRSAASVGACVRPGGSGGPDATHGDAAAADRADPRRQASTARRPGKSLPRGRRTDQGLGGLPGRAVATRSRSGSASMPLGRARLGVRAPTSPVGGTWRRRRPLRVRAEHRPRELGRGPDGDADAACGRHRRRAANGTGSRRRSRSTRGAPSRSSPTKLADRRRPGADPAAGGGRRPTPRLHPPAQPRRGAALPAWTCLRELVRRGVEPTVVSALDGRLRDDLEELGMPVHITEPASPMDDLSAHMGRVEELAAWAADRDFEAVFVNTATASRLPGREVATELGIPAVWAIHESFPRRCSGRTCAPAGARSAPKRPSARPRRWSSRPRRPARSSSRRSAGSQLPDAPLRPRPRRRSTPSGPSSTCGAERSGGRDPGRRRPGGLHRHGRAAQGAGPARAGLRADRRPPPACPSRDRRRPDDDVDSRRCGEYDRGARALRRADAPDPDHPGRPRLVRDGRPAGLRLRRRVAAADGARGDGLGDAGARDERLRPARADRRRRDRLALRAARHRRARRGARPRPEHGPRPAREVDRPRDASCGGAQRHSPEYADADMRPARSGHPSATRRSPARMLRRPSGARRTGRAGRRGRASSPWPASHVWWVATTGTAIRSTSTRPATRDRLLRLLRPARRRPPRLVGRGPGADTATPPWCRP